MHKVIDTIEHRLSWLRHDPARPQEEGLLVIINLVVDRGDARVPVRKGSQVRVRRPDETLLVHDVNRIEINPDGILGLFFSHLSATDIPRGSTIEPLGAGSTS